MEVSFNPVFPFYIDFVSMVFHLSHVDHRHDVTVQISEDGNGLPLDQNVFPILEEKVGTHFQTIVQEVDIDTVMVF